MEDAEIAVPDRVTAVVPAPVGLGAADAAADAPEAVQTVVPDAEALVLATAIQAVRTNVPGTAPRIAADLVPVVATPAVLDAVDVVGLVPDAAQTAVLDVPGVVGIAPEDALQLVEPPAEVPVRILAVGAIQRVIAAVADAEDAEIAVARIAVTLAEALARASASERRQRRFLNIWRE